MIRKIVENKIVLLLLLTGAVYFFLKILVPLSAPVLMAMLFVTIFGPFLQKLEAKCRIHRQVGAVLLLFVAVLVLGLLVWVLFSWIVGSLPEWIRGLDSLEENIISIVNRVCDIVGSAVRIDTDYLEEILLMNLQEGIDWFQDRLVPSVLSQSIRYVRILITFGGFLICFLIATVLLAKDYDNIMNRMLDKEECHLILEIICGVIRYIATYIRAQMIIMSCVGLLAAVVLTLCGIRQGVLWGLLAGVLDALPFIGTGIVLVPLGIQQFFAGRYVKTVFCLLLYVACIFVRELLEPKLIGKRVGVSPIAILLSIYAGVKLFGIWGIVGGPLGFVMIYQAYRSIERRNDRD